MKRTATILAALLTLGAVLGITACEPKATVTAKPDGYPIAATRSIITGRVTPADATKQVVLQRTVRGKWVDWKNAPATSVDPARDGRIRKANVNPITGGYSLSWEVPWCDGIILHLRVRSASGENVSPGFYTQATPGESC